MKINNKLNNTKNIKVLGIETSCDETAASVYTSNDGVMSNELFSQISIHKEFGGVIPELASREHLKKMGVITQKALDTANLKLDDIDVIAVTNKPGLPGSLLVGLCFAKSLAYAKNKQIIGINHLEGHAFSACIENDIPFPFLCITASGGHTSLYIVKDYGDYEVIGQTLDDAAGEAFDKISKLLNLGYPGGPIIEKLAQKANFKDFFNYPRAMSKSLDFSFSGVKTAVLYDLVNKGLYSLKDKKLLTEDIDLKEKVSSSLLVCISDIFKQKIKLAYKRYPEIKAVSFVGGVSCNKFIRQQLKEICLKKSLPFYVPSPEYCTDNAAMIAFVGHYKAIQGHFSDLSLDIF